MAYACLSDYRNLSDEARIERFSKPNKAPFPWITAPTHRITFETEDEFFSAINDYFQRCWDYGIRPQITGLSLALGMSGPGQLKQVAYENANLQHAISRAHSAIAYYYEEMGMSGQHQAAIFLLKHIFEFQDSVHRDEGRFQQRSLALPKESKGESLPSQHWSDKKEISIESQVDSRITVEEVSQLTPRESYMKLIQGEILSEEAQEHLENQRQLIDVRVEEE